MDGDRSHEMIFVTFQFDYVSLNMYCEYSMNVKIIILCRFYLKFHLDYFPELFLLINGVVIAC